MTPAAGEIDEIGLEQIVREVLRRLETLDIAHETTSNEANRRGPSASGLTLPGRVVSLTDVDGRLDGVTTINLMGGAVLTPAARDYLKQCGITIQREAANDANQSAPTSAAHSLVLGVAEADCESASLVSYLAKRGVMVQRLAHTGVAGVVAELCDAVALGGQRGMLLTTETTVALCMANRRRGVRAALANDSTAAEAALRSIAANAFVIDPAKAGAFQLQRVADRLCHADLNPQAGFARFLA